jgi:hypothetical protein
MRTFPPSTTHVRRALFAGPTNAGVLGQIDASNEDGMQLPAAASRPVEVLVSESGQKTIDRNRGCEAQPLADVEQGHNSNTECQEPEIVSIHIVPRSGNARQAEEGPQPKA